MILEDRRIPLHESFPIGLLLAVVGGYLDAYTYLLKGKVFANAQTGNMVLLSLQIAQRHYLQALYYLIPIAAFALGVVMTEFLKKRTPDTAFFRWRHTILAIETVVLFLVGFLPGTVPYPIINVTISFVCSLQVCSFKKLIDTPYATTMCTGNLRSAMEHLFRYFSEKDRTAGIRALRYIFIILSFCGGAALGTIFADYFRDRSIWVCCLLLLAVLCLLLYDEHRARRIVT